MRTTELQKRVLVGKIENLKQELEQAESELLRILTRKEDTQPEVRFSGRVDVRSDEEIKAEQDAHAMVYKIVAVEAFKGWAPEAEYFKALSADFKPDVL